MVRHKRLTSKSGITIPKDLRLETGFHPRMAVDMESTMGGILIRPHVPVCFFCGSVETHIKVRGIPICSGCAGKIGEEVNKSAGGEPAD